MSDEIEEEYPHAPLPPPATGSGHLLSIPTWDAVEAERNRIVAEEQETEKQETEES